MVSVVNVPGVGKGGVCLFAMGLCQNSYSCQKWLSLQLLPRTWQCHHHGKLLTQPADDDDPKFSYFKFKQTYSWHVKFSACNCLAHGIANTKGINQGVGE
jgi:hypothetical protein